MNKDFLFIRKEDANSRMSTRAIIKLFKETDDMNVIKEAVEQASDRLYVSWASVDWRDKQGEKIPIDDLIKQQDILLERHGPITDGHTNRVVGQTLAYKVMKHPRTQTMGVLHLNKIFNHSALDEEVWSETQSGKRTGSSVGGFAESNHMEIDKNTHMAVRVLGGFNQYETANVYSPANMFALNEAVSMVAKSAPEYEEALNAGTEVEMEHKATYDFLVETISSTGYMPSLQEFAESIAKDHIREDAEYYNKLSKMEAKKSDTTPIITSEKQEQTTKEENDMDEVLKSEIVSLVKSTFEELAKSMAVAKSEDKDADDKKEKDKEKEKPEEKEVEKAEAKEDPKQANEKDTFKAEAPKPEEANEKDVFKKEVKKEVKEELEGIKKSMSEMLTVMKSVTTPRPSTQVPVAKDDNLALDIALGKTKKSWEEINQMNQ